MRSTPSVVSNDPITPVSTRAGQVHLTVGGKTEVVRVEEVQDREKPPILRAYLKEWAWEVKQFFGGVGSDAPDADLARIAPKHPVFRIVA
jgi:hypothetical protein